VNRTDRLYALVEELRRVRPGSRSARWLAGLFEVDVRTIRRDIDALQQAGVPIYAEAGRRGGYVLDRAYTLPPLNISPREAIATAVALTALARTPFAAAARSALHKLVSVMAPHDLAVARAMAGNICLAEPEPDDVPGAAGGAVMRTAEEALWSRSVLAIEYFDRNGAASSRAVEPLGLARGGEHWYLVGWCRLRGGVREFRLDRVRQAARTDEVALPRLSDLAGLTVGDLVTAQLRLEDDTSRVGKADRTVPPRRASMRSKGASARRRDSHVDGQHQSRHRPVRRSPVVALDAMDRAAKRRSREH
jgi:predicted DNA-binding transcriptional regulator YafY